MNRPPNWGDLGSAREPAPHEVADEPFAELCARLFTTGDGREFIKKIREDTIEVNHPPGVPEAVLRDMEGQRRLVRRIENATARGLELAAAKKAKG